MTKLNLSIATNDYDHFRDFRLGDVRAEGIDHNWFIFTHHECFARFTANREFDLAELSFAKFATQVTREESEKGYKVRVEKQVIGRINGGETEFRFKTYNGDIIIRKADG